MQVLVVDGANVVGSRPDGWWRDRGAAAGRLAQQMASADLPHDRVVLVLEGAARAGVVAGRYDERVEVLHAPDHGDDAIVAAAAAQVREGHAVTVVTADRGLRARVVEAGAEVAPPSWLLGRL